MSVKRTVLVLSLLTLVVLPGSAVLAEKPGSGPIDLDTIAFRGVVPGETSMNQTITALGEPNEQRIRHLLVYRELSCYVELLREKNAVSAIYLFLVPSPDVLGSPSLYGLQGNAELAASLGKLYSYKRISALSGARKTTPTGWEILHVSRSGRTASFAYEPVKHTLLQVAISKD